MDSTWPEAATLLAPLAAWFNANHRAMPWRAENLDLPHPDPYAVLVSEVMLQQTQVATVIPYFKKWMQRFPTPQSLKEADEAAIHKYWEGLGYYRRCRFLKTAASEIAEHGWPIDLTGLIALPGLGAYTAAAIGSIAFQWPTPALDGNAFRVLARLLLIEGDPKAQAKALREWLTPALTAHGPSRLTQAIMELGATICSPKPKCEQCPLMDRCQAKKQNRSSEIPPVAERAKVKELSIWLLAVEGEDHFLLLPPKEKGLLAGLWSWPLVERSESLLEQVAETSNPYSAAKILSWPDWTQVYTHRRESVTPLRVTLAHQVEFEGMRWIPQKELPSLALGRRDQKLRDLLKTPGQELLEPPDPIRLLARLKNDEGLSK
jgi:A/G-specific adenine glycosylase